MSDNGNYSDLLDSLKSSKDKKYNEVYNELLTKGCTDSSNVPILGAVVYGAKDEITLFCSLGPINNTNILYNSIDKIYT